MNIENKFIKCLNEEHGAKIIEFFEKQGARNYQNYCGDAVGFYYGVSDGGLVYATLSKINRIGCEIIELPEENVYPKVMMVSDGPITTQNEGCKRVVFMVKNGYYFAWNGAETFEDAEKEMGLYRWKYAVDVPKENPQKVEMLKRVDELKTNIAKMQKQVDEIQAEVEKI